MLFINKFFISLVVILELHLQINDLTEANVPGTNLASHLFKHHNPSVLYFVLLLIIYFIVIATIFHIEDLRGKV